MPGNNTSTGRPSLETEENSDASVRRSDSLKTAAAPRFSSQASGAELTGSIANSSSSSPPPPPPPRSSPFSSHTGISHGLVLPSSPMNDTSTTAPASKHAIGTATSAPSATGPKDSNSEGARNSQGRCSPPLSSSSERPLPSPPRPDRLSQTQSLGALGPSTDEHLSRSENASSQMVSSRRTTDAIEQHFVSDTPKHAAPLYLAATATFRSAEEEAKESAASASPSGEAVCGEHALSHVAAATATPETPQGAVADQSQNTSLLSPSPRADAEASSASRQLLLSADRGPGDGTGASDPMSRWRRGASKDFYMEEAEDFATMYKNAGLIPPDLDELEDEVLLGRSLSPALLMAKQRELSQLSRPSPHTSSSSSNVAAGAPQPALAPRPSPEALLNHHTAARASFSSASATRFSTPSTSATVPPSHLASHSHDRVAPFQTVRAVPRGPIVHTTHYPYTHGMPMPVFVGSGSAGAGGGGGSAAGLSRHASMTHSLAASTTGHHDGQAGLATSEVGSKTGGETKHAHHDREHHHHDRRHRHRHHHHRRDASSQSHTSHDDTRKPRKSRSGAHKHGRHAASATLPNSPGSFPATRAGPHAASSSSVKDDPLLARVPDSPILPEPHCHFAQSALQPNERAPHFPRHFGYLATDDQDDDGAGGDGSSPRGSRTTTATTTTTTTARTSATVTPTSKEPNAARAGEHYDVLYSLVPSTRVSSRCVSPLVITAGSSPAQPDTAIHTSGGDENDDDDDKAGEKIGVRVPVSHGTNAPGLMRANTAPTVTQEESQRQLQEALSALGLYMRPSGTSASTGSSQTQTEPVPAAPTHAATPHPLAPTASAAQAPPPRRPQLPPEGTLSTPVAPQTSQSEFPSVLIPTEASEPMNAADTLWGSAMPTFEPQSLGTPLNAQRRSLTVPSVNSLLVPAGGSAQTQASASAQNGPTSSDGGATTAAVAAGTTSQAASFTPSMSFNPVRNASFLLNASFGQLANFSLLREGSMSSSKISQQNRSALVMELERRRNRLVKQLAQQQHEATMGNVFALVRGSNAWQLQYLLQEGLVDVNERDYNGCTPLHVAALEGNQAIARILLSFGADVLAVDRWGRTPLDCAAVNRHGSVGRYLLAVIRNKQQHRQGHAQDHDASSQAVAAALEGEDSMPPTPFGLSAPTHNSHSANGLDVISSGTPSTAPGTAASTMPDTLSVSPHGLGANTSGSIKDGGSVGAGGGEWQDDANGDAMTRLLVPGGELVERKHEQSLQRRRARRGSAAGLAGSLDTAGDEGETSCDSAHHGPSSIPSNNSRTMAPLALAGKENEESTTTAAASLSVSAPSTPWATAPTAGPDSAHGSHVTSASASIGAPAQDGTHTEPSPSSSFSSSMRNRQKQIHAVSRGRSRRPKTQERTHQQSALFAAEEDKFLEEQEEQIAEEVSVAAGVPIGSPTFYPKAASRAAGAASSPASTGPSSVPAALPASTHATGSPAQTAGESGEASQANSGADTTSCSVTETEMCRHVDSAASPAAANDESALTPATHRDAREEEAHKAHNAEEGAETVNSGPRFSIFTTISDTVSLIVCMCGLPGRGKSFISKRLVRYINWKGVPCRVFNAGNYRRQMLGVAGTSDAAFFDPNNPQGKEMRERMAELACEDLVRFIASHVLAVGILDATNTTKARRTRLKHFFEKECQKFGLSYRMLFIESVCTDETIITENILRSKCDNDDFKDVQDTNEVIAEFRDRIHQYEKVYETLDPCEGLPFIKIINVKHHVIIHKVDSGLGSRIAFFLQNLHPVAYPIYIVMAGETYGDQQGVFGGDERLTDRGEEFAVALKQFIQDRYVPNMVVLHATNPSVLSTLRPLMEGGNSNSSGGGGGGGGYDSHGNASGSPAMSQSAASTATRTGVVSLKDEHTARASTGVASGSAGSQPGTKPASPITNTSSPTGQRHSHRSSPASRGAHHHVFPTELPPRKLHESNVSADELVRLAGGDVRAVAISSPSSNSPHGQQGHYGASLHHSSSSSSPSSSCSFSSSCSSSNATSSHSSEDDEDEEEEAEEVLCPVPGLDNVNFGRFSGHSAGWVREKYPRLSALLYISALDDEAKNEACARGSQTSPTSSAAHGSPVTALTASRASSPEYEGVPRALAMTVSPPCSAKLKDGGLAWFKHAPSHMDPLLAYCVQFPNGESCRQVNARLEPALMAVMRTQSPVFVVAPAVPAQGMLAFFADVIPELSPTLRIPRHCVIELGVKDDVTVHPLVPGAGISGMKAPSSPLMDDEEIQEALKMASTLAATAATAEVGKDGPA